MTRPIRDLDVPLHRLEADLQAHLALKTKAAVVASLDPFARMACEHPDACSCDTDYPGWTARIAAQTTNQQPGRAS